MSGPEGLNIQIENPKVLGPHVNIFGDLFRHSPGTLFENDSRIVSFTF